MKNLEIRTIEHKGIKVTIRINYDDGTAELVERIDGRWKVKQWVFKPRGLEYMIVWQDVLAAMQVAISLCKVELEKNLAEKSKFSEEFINKVEKDNDFEEYLKN
jgi:hypothetical protein